MPPVIETVSSPSPALRPPPGNPRFPLFDSLRAIAALSVVACHVTGVAGAEMTWWGKVSFQLLSGLSIFFVISGFLLYRPFVAARAAGRPSPRISDFALRRVLRIVPGYWFALTVLAVWPGVPYVVGPFTDRSWIYYGFGQIYRTSTVRGGIAPAWSLCVEVSFYALLPLYALFAGRLSRRFGLLRGGLLPLGLIAFVSLIVRFLAQVYYIIPLRVALPSNMFLFAIGMGLAVLSVALHGKELDLRAVRVIALRPGLCWAAAFGCLVVAGSRFPIYEFGSSAWRSSAHLLANDLLGAMAALLIVFPAVFGQKRGGLPRRILASRTLTWLGVVSYGMYLWHYPLLFWLAGTGHVPLAQAPFGRLFHVTLTPLELCAALGALTLAMTVVAAAFSYYVVELPFLRRKETKLPRVAPTTLARLTRALRHRSEPSPTRGNRAEDEGETTLAAVPQGGVAS
jgi:peptidoglycan/LPS O-acetylase OafA/YrhL